MASYLGHHQRYLADNPQYKELISNDTFESHIDRVQQIILADELTAIVIAVENVAKLDDIINTDCKPFISDFDSIQSRIKANAKATESSPVDAVILFESLQTDAAVKSSLIKHLEKMLNDYSDQYHLQYLAAYPRNLLTAKSLETSPNAILEQLSQLARIQAAINAINKQLDLAITRYAEVQAIVVGFVGYFTQMLDAGAVNKLKQFIATVDQQLIGAQNTRNLYRQTQILPIATEYDQVYVHLLDRIEAQVKKLESTPKYLNEKIDTALRGNNQDLFTSYQCLAEIKNLDSEISRVAETIEQAIGLLREEDIQKLLAYKNRLEILRTSISDDELQDKIPDLSAKVKVLVASRLKNLDSIQATIMNLKTTSTPKRDDQTFVEYYQQEKTAFTSAFQLIHPFYLQLEDENSQLPEMQDETAKQLKQRYEYLLAITKDNGSKISEALSEITKVEKFGLIDDCMEILQNEYNEHPSLLDALRERIKQPNGAQRVIAQSGNIKIILTKAKDSLNALKADLEQLKNFPAYKLLAENYEEDVYTPEIMARWHEAQALAKKTAEYEDTLTNFEKEFAIYEILAHEHVELNQIELAIPELPRPPEVKRSQQAAAINVSEGHKILSETLATVQALIVRIDQQKNRLSNFSAQSTAEITEREGQILAKFDTLKTELEQRLAILTPLVESDKEYVRTINTEAKSLSGAIADLRAKLASVNTKQLHELLRPVSSYYEHNGSIVNKVTADVTGKITHILLSEKVDTLQKLQVELEQAQALYDQLAKQFRLIKSSESFVQLSAFERAEHAESLLAINNSFKQVESDLLEYNKIITTTTPEIAVGLELFKVFQQYSTIQQEFANAKKKFITDSEFQRVEAKNFADYIENLDDHLTVIRSFITNLETFLSHSSLTPEQVTLIKDEFIAKRLRVLEMELVNDYAQLKSIPKVQNVEFLNIILHSLPKEMTPQTHDAIIKIDRIIESSRDPDNQLEPLIARIFSDAAIKDEVLALYNSRIEKEFRNNYARLALQHKKTPPALDKATALLRNSFAKLEQLLPEAINPLPTINLASLTAKVQAAKDEYRKTREDYIEKFREDYSVALFTLAHFPQVDRDPLRLFVNSFQTLMQASNTLQETFVEADVKLHYLTDLSATATSLKQYHQTATKMQRAFTAAISNAKKFDYSFLPLLSTLLKSENARASHGAIIQNYGSILTSAQKQTLLTLTEQVEQTLALKDKLHGLLGAVGGENIYKQIYQDEFDRINNFNKGQAAEADRIYKEHNETIEAKSIAGSSLNPVLKERLLAMPDPTLSDIAVTQITSLLENPDTGWGTFNTALKRHKKGLFVSETTFKHIKKAEQIRLLSTEVNAKLAENGGAEVDAHDLFAVDFDLARQQLVAHDINLNILGDDARIALLSQYKISTQKRNDSSQRLTARQISQQKKHSQLRIFSDNLIEFSEQFALQRNRVKNLKRLKAIVEASNDTQEALESLPAGIQAPTVVEFVEDYQSRLTIQDAHFRMITSQIKSWYKNLDKEFRIILSATDQTISKSKTSRASAGTFIAEMDQAKTTLEELLAMLPLLKGVDYFRSENISDDETYQQNYNRLHKSLLELGFNDAEIKALIVKYQKCLANYKELYRVYTLLTGHAPAEQKRTIGVPEVSPGILQVVPEFLEEKERASVIQSLAASAPSLPAFAQNQLEEDEPSVSHSILPANASLETKSIRGVKTCL